MKDASARHASWQELLALPEPACHIVQIYDSHAFLANAVAHFAAEGLRRDEAVLLTGTPAHLRGIRRGLAARDVDAAAAVRCGQLLLWDAEQAVEAVTVDGRLDEACFGSLAGDALKRAVSGGRFSGVRWWGEMSRLMLERDQVHAALRAEDLADAAAAEHGIRLFCSYMYDCCDARSYDRLCDLCSRHTHVIPADDYVGHRLAVNHAVAEEIGEIRGPLLQSLLSWKGLACDLPSSQALLFWVREALPERFPAVLSRMRAFQS